jgi:predicted ferric reductase
MARRWVHPAVAAHPPRRPIPDHGGRRTVRVAWLLVYALAVIAPLALVLAPDAAPPRSFMLELGSALGIAALSLLALQLALPARLPALAAIGAEVAVRLHRRTADIMLAVIVAHVAAVMIADPSRLALLGFVGQPWRAQAAIGSVAAILVLFLTSLARRRIRLPYAGWRGLHVVAGALALVLAVVHTVGVGRYLVRGPAELALVLLTIAGLGALVVTRSRRLRAGSVRPYTVQRVVHERGGAITLVLAADGHRGQAFIPGQFAWLRPAGARTLLVEHPFSYSSSALDPVHPTFTMQPRSGFSAQAAEFEPGTPLLVDGPHGAFRPRARAAGTILVAGGIGITPSMSILRTAADRGDPRPYLLLYGARNLSGLPFLEDIEDLQVRMHLEVVIVLSAPDPDWPGERGRINAGVMDRHLPLDLRRWQFMVCGAGPFVDGVIDAFEAVGVPGEHVHAERFVEV